MNLYTLGHKHYLGYCFSIMITKDTSTLRSESVKNYYKLFYINAEKYEVLLNGKKLLLLGPNLLYINDRDQIELHSVNKDECKIVYFHPSVFNSRLDFESCNEKKELSITDKQDLFYLEKFKWNVKNEAKIISLNENSSLLIGQKLDRLTELLSEQDTMYWPCMSRTNMLEILFHIAQTGSQEGSILYLEQGDSSLVSKVIEYLGLHYGDKITLEQLASTFGTNRTTLQNEFKKVIDKSPLQYLTQIRMKIACTLLKDTLIPINDICDRTGFSDMSYFVKVFKKEIGITPGEYRKTYNNID
ncbi:helix-turn-helix domain-containing protein [Anaerosporobacter sp.]